MLRKALGILVFIWALTSVGCSKAATNSSVETSLRAGENAPNQTRLYQRENLTAARSNALADFILPDVREKLDAEPTSQDEIPIYEPQVDSPSTEPVDTSETLSGEDAFTNPDELDKLNYSWAKRKWGEALKKDETARGVLVLYADDNYYDIGRLTGFIEDGRNRIAVDTEIDAGRIQVVYGGYRGMAQVEFWLVPEGGTQPVPKPQERNSPDSEK